MNVIGNYEIVYILSNVLGTYIIYKFMKIFFDSLNLERWKEILSYILYFFIISALYLFVNIPMVMMVSNIIGLFVLSFVYGANMKRRMIAVAYIYIILMVIESIVALASGYFEFPLFTENDYSSIMGVLIVKVISYVVVLSISNYKNIRKGIEIPLGYWGAILIIPVGSLYIMIVLFQARILQVQQVIICAVLLLFINFVTFYLYDALNHLFEVKLREITVKHQNRYYTKQLEIMKKSISNIKSVHHDLNKHVSMLRTFINKNENEKAIVYIDKIVDVAFGEKIIANTGHLAVDSIINFELESAKENNVNVSLQLSTSIPKLNIADYDITIILGNLLNNAMNATCMLDNNKKIDVQMNYEKGTLYIFVENTFDGKVLFKDNVIQSRRDDKENHGMGLYNIKNAVMKYNGSSTVEQTDKLFRVEILLYVSDRNVINNIS